MKTKIKKYFKDRKTKKQFKKFWKIAKDMKFIAFGIPESLQGWAIQEEKINVELRLLAREHIFSFSELKSAYMSMGRPEMSEFKKHILDCCKLGKII